MKQIKLSIIIVNYKTPRLTLDALESITQDDMSGLDYTVYLIDNCSNDDSVDLLTETIHEKQWTDWVDFIPLNENKGFAFGNNAALNRIMKYEENPDYLWFLNPDTIIHRGACKNLLDFLENHPKAGIAGSRLEDPDGTQQISAFRDFSIRSEMVAGFNLFFLSRIFSQHTVAPQMPSDQVHTTAWVSGASMMCKADVLRDIGQFDDNFFLYYEEVDLCLRARRAGWQCWFIPESRVIHLVGASTGISDLRKKAPRRPSYWFESRRRFFLKNYHWNKLLFADLLWMTGYITYSIRKCFSKKRQENPPYFLWDFFRNSVFCKGIKIL